MFRRLLNKVQMNSQISTNEKESNRNNLQEKLRKYISYTAIGLAGFTILGVNYIWAIALNNYSKTLKCPKEEGTACIRIYDEDGLDKLVVTNNTASNKELTQIPDIKLQNLYASSIPINLYNLKKGYYIFKVKYIDDLGNLEQKTIKLDIKNNGGGQSLYGAKAEIENLRLPTGKETFELR